jgi:hypothetical protein
MTTPTARHGTGSSASSHANSRKESSMTSKSASRSSPARKASGNELGALNFMTELSRQQLAIASEGASALYRGSEALRKVQQEAAHEASLHHAQAARKLFTPCQPSDLLSVQTELMRTNVESATHYWQQLMVVALQMHREMILSLNHMLDSESGGGMKSALEAFQAAVPPMATSFFIPSHSELNEQPHH